MENMFDACGSRFFHSIDVCTNFKQGKRGISLMLPHIHDFKVLKSVA